MSLLEEKFIQLCNNRSDINQHLPTLKLYAQECNSVFETGVRTVVSSYALLYGLTENTNDANKIIFLNDTEMCDINEFETIAKSYSVSVKYEWMNNLDLSFSNDETYDLTFIDTWHIYGQLKRELDKFSKITNKYIIMHDTEIDGIYGEEIRNSSGMDRIELLSIKTNMPHHEILQGLKPAIDAFLSTNLNWKIDRHYINNNGLTILKKMD
jgi:hypothetical protein